jgi:hypothetical protein
MRAESAFSTRAHGRCSLKEETHVEKGAEFRQKSFENSEEIGEEQNEIQVRGIRQQDGMTSECK